VPDTTDAAPPPSAPLPQLVLELREMVVGYVKQETVVPLKQLGRYIGFGIVGSFLLGLGTVLLAVGGLRALQTETGSTFAGDWSWAPYGIVFVALMLGAAVTWKVRNSALNRRAKRELAARTKGETG
jgi:hypothetical protein